MKQHRGGGWSESGPLSVTTDGTTGRLGHFHVPFPRNLLFSKRQLNLVEICKSLDEKGLTKNEAYPLWIW